MSVLRPKKRQLRLHFHGFWRLRTYKFPQSATEHYFAANHRYLQLFHNFNLWLEKSHGFFSGNVFTFSTQVKGKKTVPYGTAGDCYSERVNCPQGRFSIDLTGTSFRVSHRTLWKSYGNQASAQINKEVSVTLQYLDLTFSWSNFFVVRKFT